MNDRIGRAPPSLKGKGMSDLHTTISSALLLILPYAQMTIVIIFINQKMINMKKPILLIFLALFFYNGFSQNPCKDQSWILVPEKSDEFSGASLNASKWYKLDTSFQWGVEEYSSDYAIVGVKAGEPLTKDGYLTLLTKKVGSVYYTGGIKSNVTNATAHGYGYFEIKARIPKGKGFWTAFWLNASNGSLSNPPYWFDEIDILEPSGCTSLNANVNVTGWWDEYKSSASDQKKKYGETVQTNLPDLSISDHKFAVEWLPNRIIFYFDDQPFASFYNRQTVPSHPMHIYINQEIGPIDNAFLDSQYANLFPDPVCLPDASTDISLPQCFSIDYFRYYQLKMDCNTVVNQSNVDFTTFNYAVKKSITIGNSTIPQNSNVTLRATDFIQLNGGFTLPLGSELNIVPTPCF
mgnify:CR=1 FL=1